ncbi:GumC family protein [Tranquillimonas rosea]|uniref:GumC family protein n=1 Tax=Tranquillimonas rosea TaxID=641238 RepID=UPI003BA85B7D
MTVAFNRDGMQEQRNRLTRQSPTANSVARGEDHDSIDIFQILRTLWRGKLVIALCVAVCALVGGYYAYVAAVPKYAASTSLALQVRDQQPVDLQSVVSGVSTDSQSMNTELEVIKSRGLITDLVRELDLTADPEFNAALRPAPPVSIENAKDYLRGVWGVQETTRDEPPNPDAELNRTIGAVRSAISTSIQRNTYIFNIRVETWSAAKSAQIANTLADLYLQDQIETKFEATEGAVSWLSERVVDLETEIQEREDELAEVQSQSNFTSPEQITGLNAQVRETRQRVTQLQQEQEQLNARLSSLEDAVSSGNISEILNVADDPTLQRIEGRLDQETLLEEGSSFQARLATLRTQFRSDLERTASQEESLRDSLTRLESRLETQSEELARVQQMRRELEATSVLYETFLTRLKETTVQQGIQQADARVLSSASGGSLVAPDKARILLLSIVLGLVAGSGGVLLYDYTRSGFRTADVLESTTGVPVIGQIPRIPIRRRGKLLEYLNAKPTSAAAEAIRNLRTSVLLSDLDHPPQVIMSTSSIPGEGKTTQAISLAHNLVGLGKKVLLIEGDIRRRTFTQYFSEEGDAGILTVVSGEKPLSEVAVRPHDLDADVLMGEKSKINAADVFASDRFRDFLQKVRQEYDFVIVDTPPVLVVPDARVIGQYCDAIVYTVNWDQTSKRQVLDGLRELSSVNLHVNGLVLAQIDPKGMKRYGYGGRYGAYSRYGRGYYDS